jgi:hypothetical protein
VIVKPRMDVPFSANGDRVTVRHKLTSICIRGKLGSTLGDAQGWEALEPDDAECERITGAAVVADQSKVAGSVEKARLAARLSRLS